MTWETHAENFTGMLSKDAIPVAVRTCLSDVKPEDSVGIACSGGVDSVFLLLLVYDLYPELRSQLIVLHFNHKLRGEESDADETFVRSMANDLGLKFKSEQRISEQGCDGQHNEAVLREDRLAFFKASGCAYHLVGHQKNDIAETMLMRLARGSGIDGLAAPRSMNSYEDQITFLRPLLDFTRDEIESQLSALKIPWCEDSSNQTDDYFRNRVRHQVLPLLNLQTQHDFLQSAARSRALLQEDAEALSELCEALIPNELLQQESVCLEKLAGSPKAILRRFLHRWLGEKNLRGILSASSFDFLLGKLISGETVRHSCGHGSWICSDKGRLWLEKSCDKTVWEPAFLQLGGSRQFPHGKCLKFTQVRLTSELRKSILSGCLSNEHEVYLACFPGEQIDQLWVRPWCPGDAYKPLGAPGKRKLQNIFVDKKIEVQERKKRPVVCLDEATILWCPGLPPSDKRKITKETGNALRLTYL